MTVFKSALLAAAATLAIGASAQAADAIRPIPVMPVAPVASAFDWNGLYAGISAGAQNEYNVPQTSWLLGAQLGVNASFDFFLVGGEVAVQDVFDTPDTYAYGEVLVRAGVLVSNEVLLYGAAGYGSDFGAVTGPGSHILAGGGLEFAVTSDVSLRAQYLHGWAQGGGNDIHKFTIGANFHF